MVDKNQNMGRIKFLEEAMENKSITEDKITNDKKDNTKQEVEIKPARKLNNNESVASRFGDAILSAGQGNIKDTGGPLKQLGSETNNSIWDSEILDRIKGSQDNKEKTIESKERIEHLRNSLKQGRLDQMVESIKETDTRKDATVQNIGEYQERGVNYIPPQNNISIFDKDSDFSRVPEKTAGELAAEEANVEKEKDDSWKDVKGATKRSNTLDNLFDAIISSKEE